MNTQPAIETASAQPENVRDILRCATTLSDRESKLIAQLAELTAQRDELLTACEFLMSQVEKLASHAFSSGVQEWLERNDAMNCAKRAIHNAEQH